MEVAAEWPWRRVAAFGDWNYPRGGGGSGDDWNWPAVTECSDDDVSVPVAVSHPAYKHTTWARPPPNARHKRIPAFGEWNHHRSDGGGGWPAAAVTPFLDLTAATTTPKTKRLGGDCVVAAAKLPATAELHGRRRSKVAAYPARRSCFTVAKAVDDDLYGIPPDLVYEKPARKARWWLRILLMGRCCCPRGSETERLHDWT